MIYRDLHDYIDASMRDVINAINYKNRYRLYYSIVKDSSADLGVNSKIVQIRPTVKAVCTKMSKNFFCIFVNILIFLNESREDHFEYFEYLRKTALY